LPLENKSGNGSGPWGGDPGKSPPKNPWGQPPKPPGGDGGPGDGGRPSGGNGGGSGGGNNGPDFDAFIRRSQERIRASLNGGGGSGAGGLRHEGGIPWGYIAAGIALLWIAFTSTYRIGAQERGVIQRFGRYIETTGPGLHFKLPTPIDTVTPQPVESVESINIDASEGGENLILTGDQNIINVAYTVRWKISDPVRYQFELAEPKNTIKEVAESAMRSEVGQVTLQAAIGPQRQQIGEQVRTRMQELLNSYSSGVEIVGVDIRKADPPAAVDEAFKAVTAAQQNAQSAVNNAQAHAQEVINKAQGDTAIFDALFAQYKLAPEVTRRRLYYETMEEVLGHNQTTVIESKGTVPYLPIPPARAAASEPAPAPKGAAK